VSEINATPVFWKNRIYIATGQDPEHGEGVGHLVCIDATKTGDVTSSATIWSYKRHPPQHLDRLARSAAGLDLRGRFLWLHPLPRR